MNGGTLSRQSTPPVSVVIVTRGDVDLYPVTEPFAKAFPSWQIAVWDNSERADMKVYGRYCAAADLTYSDTFFFVDDDVILPVETIKRLALIYVNDVEHQDMMLVNDAHGDNPAGLEDVGFLGAGSMVSRGLMDETWRRWHDVHPVAPWLQEPLAESGEGGLMYECDFVFGILCPHITVKLPYTARFPNHGNRLCDQRWHNKLKYEYAEMARKIRDA